MNTKLVRYSDPHCSWLQIFLFGAHHKSYLFHLLKLSMGMLKRKKVKKCFCVSCHFMLSFVSKCPCSQEEVGSEEACFSVRDTDTKTNGSSLVFFFYACTFFYYLFNFRNEQNTGKRKTHFICQMVFCLPRGNFEIFKRVISFLPPFCKYCKFFLEKYLLLTAHNYCFKFIFITLNNLHELPRAIVII